ncbi:MAG: hypothetical protein Q8O41_04790, partial [Candidatus Methanoperedens sp.]|nr:hypothetical protein [Candidatus Methanoperedens sp.]
MDAKDSKVPIYIAILVAVILIAAGGYFALGGPAKLSKEKPAATPAETPAKTAAPGEAPVVAAPVKVETIKCELCHKDSQTLKPHVDGGKLCVNCHGSQVHSIHIGTGTIDMKCDSCHGPPQKITVPKVEKGEGPGHFSTCEQCHAPP